MDGGTTDAASECGGLEPADCMEGRLRTRGRPGLRNGVSHDIFI